MDQERFERSVFGPTRSVSRPSPVIHVDAYLLAEKAHVGQRTASTAIRPIGPRVAASSCWQPDLTMQLRQPDPGLQVGDANLTMAGSMNFLPMWSEPAAHILNSWYCGQRTASTAVRPFGLRVAAMATRPYHGKLPLEDHVTQHQFVALGRQN